jgi:hypothetical protein
MAEYMALEIASRSSGSAKEEIAEAQLGGIKPATWNRAKKELHVESKKSRLSGGWKWSLPEGDHKPNARKS